MGPTHSVHLQEQVSLLDRLSSRYSLRADPTLSDLVHVNPKRKLKFQRWFRYREAYDPKLLELAVSRLKAKPRLVVDPFCGSGTTLVAAQELGADSLGIDFNPVLVALSKAKTTPYSPSDIKNLGILIESALDISPFSSRSLCPPFPLIDKLFNPDILAALLAVRHNLETIASDKLKTFMLVGWLSSLEALSNAYKEGNGLKYRNRKRTPSGYYSIPWSSTPLYNSDAYKLVITSLREQYLIMLEDLNSLPLRATASSTVMQGSALSLGAFSEHDSADLVLFSPPYCNNFNYTKIFKLELWMSGFVQSASDMRALNKTAVRSHVETSTAITLDSVMPTELTCIVEWISEGELWHPRIPEAVSAYFSDMSAALQQVWSLLKSGGVAQIVVGNSAYAGVLVPTDLLLSRVAEMHGFKVEEITVARHLTTSSQQRGRLDGLLHGLRESIISLRKV